MKDKTTGYSNPIVHVKSLFKEWEEQQMALQPKVYGKHLVCEHSETDIDNQ